MISIELKLYKMPSLNDEFYTKVRLKIRKYLPVSYLHCFLDLDSTKT